MCNKTKKSCFKITKIASLIIKLFIGQRKDLKAITIKIKRVNKKVNKIALSSNDDKRLQTYDRITTYPYGTNAFKVCESEMLIVKDLYFEKLK